MNTQTDHLGLCVGKCHCASFFQAPSSCSCHTPRGSTRVDSSVAGGTPPPLTARGLSVGRSGSGTTGPTTPCWPRPGGRGCWGTRGSLTAYSETSPISVPTRTTDCSTFGRAVMRKWMPVPPDGRRADKQCEQIIFNIYLSVDDIWIQNESWNKLILWCCVLMSLCSL